MIVEIWSVQVHLEELVMDLPKISDVWIQVSFSVVMFLNLRGLLARLSCEFTCTALSHHFFRNLEEWF